MQTRSSDENSVCPSVCLFVRLSHACIVAKRKKDLSIYQPIPIGAKSPIFNQ